jgi:CxxC motif-containing protein
MEKIFTCIVCPRGCRITVDEDMNIAGNLCKRGIDYVKTELTDPKRIVTTTVRTIYTDIPRISVKTDNPIPKAMIYEIMAVINKTVIDKPMKIGEVLIENILDTNVNIVLTKSCLPEEKDNE